MERSVSKKLHIIECKYCDYKTKNNGHLETHMKCVHFGIKTFACQFCENKAGQKKTFRNSCQIPLKTAM